MRKLTVNRLAAMIVALLLVVMAPVSALAADGNLTTPTDLAPVTRDVAAADDTASNVTEPAKEEAPAETTPAPAKENPAPKKEATEQPEAKPTESLETKAAEEPDKEESTAGSVTIILRTAGPLYYGDEVALGALVNGVEGEFTLTWQAKVDANRWEDVGEGYTYKFILSPANANLEYRVVLNVVE